jgi:hypothetical protein
MICPKCGFDQPDGGLECPRCGVVFSRYKVVAAPGLARPLAPWTQTAAIAPPPAAPAAGQIYSGPEPDWPAHGGQAAATGAPVAPAPPAAATLYGGGSGKLREDAAVVGMAMRPAPAVPPRPGVPGAAPPGPASPGGAPGRFSPGAPPAAGFTMAPAFGTGEVLGDTFSIFFNNLIPFLLIAVVVVAPLCLGVAMVGSLGGRSALLVGALVLVAGGLLTTPLVTGAITFGVVQELRGREASIGDCLGRGLASIWRVFLVALLQGFAIFGGLLLCIVPGVIAAVALSVAVPAAIEEREGTSAALRRSVELTEGRRLAVFGVLVVLGLAQFLLGRGVALLAPAVTSNASLLARTLPSLAISPLTTSLQATAAAVMYYRLRASREAIDVGALPSVFD